MEFADWAVLANAGSITAEVAKAHAESEFEKYRTVQEQLYESDFDRAVKAQHDDIIELEQIERQSKSKE